MEEWRIWLGLCDRAELLWLLEAHWHTGTVYSLFDEMCSYEQEKGCAGILSVKLWS